MSRRAIAATTAGVALIIVAAFGFGVKQFWRRAEKPAPPATPQRVREPAVAGLFYPKEGQALSQMLDVLLANAPSHSIADLRALICPHAGYQFSGQTAAFGYKLLAGREFQTVVLLAPSHYVPFRGASVTDADVYRTPLGDVPISVKARELATVAPFMLEPHGLIQRPDWWTQSSRAAPAVGNDSPDTWEHSGEVQVPFMQKVLKKFQLLSVVLGDVDAEPVARAIADRLDDKTFIIASSDLSHYHPYQDARQLDTRCVNAICNMDIAQMQSQEACGRLPILTLMHIAKLKGWKPKLLDYRNSGDVTGDKTRGVVGYAAIAFYGQAPEAFNVSDRKLLLSLARKSLTQVVTTGRLPEADAGLPEKFAQPKGCFVTLTERGALRGCIGNILPQAPLYRAIMENARSSATRDTRFQPVRPDELDKIEIEISVLTVPQPLPFSSPDDLLGKLQPHRDGVVLQIPGNGSATYLPQVWEMIPDKTAFLNTLSEKAGSPPTAWRTPGTTVFTYRVESFKESEM